MRTFMNMATNQGDQGTDMGLIVCSGCNEVIDTLPTNGVKIIHGFCGKEECGGNPPDSR